jgi:hypothetical protein
MPIFISMKPLHACIALLLTACTYQSVEKTLPEINTVRMGEKFRITLPEDHSRKGTWRIMDNFDAHVVDHTSSVWHGNAKGVDFNFKSLSAGLCTLHFVSRHYNDTIAQRAYIVNVIP